MQKILLILIVAVISLYAKHFEDLSEACEVGNVRACYDVGLSYKTGNGVEKNYAKAEKFFLIACEGGDYVGCNSLGLLYVQGRGMKVNHKKADIFWEKACKGGIVRGCYNLGVSYRNNKKFSEAIKIFTKVCNDNDAKGCIELANMYYYGLGSQKNLLEAKKFYKKACELGNKRGCKYYNE